MEKTYRKVFKTPWFSIEASSIKCLGKLPYYRLSCPDSVQILAFTDKRKIILVRQFRPALGISTLELPSGYVENGESASATIKRELLEETGFVCDSLVSMGALKIAPSRIYNNLHVFFGKNAKRKNSHPAEKGTKVILVSNAEFKRLIMKADFFETAGLAIYLLAKLRGFL